LLEIDLHELEFEQEYGEEEQISREYHVRPRIDKKRNNYMTDEMNI